MHQSLVTDYWKELQAKRSILLENKRQNEKGSKLLDLKSQDGILYKLGEGG